MAEVSKVTGFREHVDVRYLPPLLDIPGLVRITAATSPGGYARELLRPTAKRPAYCSVHTLDEAERWIRNESHCHEWEELLPADWRERLHEGNARARYHYVRSDARLQFGGIWVVGDRQTSYIEVRTFKLITHPMVLHRIPAVFRAMDGDLRRLVARIWVYCRAYDVMSALER